MISIFRLICAILFICVMWGIPLVSFAKQQDMFSGFAWSDNIGWISFNCVTTDSCADVEYGVTTTAGKLSGLAWSPHIGWISFNSDEACKKYISYASVESCLDVHTFETIISEDRKLFGTARALSTNETPYRIGESNDDRWDGTIKMNNIVNGSVLQPVADGDYSHPADFDWPENQYYMMDGYAWGGTNIGWIAFSCQTINRCGDTTGGFWWGTFLAPFEMSFTTNLGSTEEDAVSYDGSFQHTWALSPVDEIASCVGSGGPGSWSDIPTKNVLPSPVTEIVNNAQTTKTSNLKCTNRDGKHQERALVVHVKPPPPSLSLTVFDKNIPYDTEARLSWRTENVASCSPSGGKNSWQNLRININSLGDYVTEKLTDDISYNLSCASPALQYYPNSVFDTIRITVQKLTLDFSVVDDSGKVIETDDLFAYTDKDNINLRWETEFATGGCVASGDWSGQKVARNANHDTVNGNESPPIPEGGDFTYTLTCTGVKNQRVEKTIAIEVSKNPDFSEEVTNGI